MAGFFPGTSTGVTLSPEEVRFEKAFVKTLRSIGRNEAGNLIVGLVYGVPGDDGSSRGFGPHVVGEIGSPDATDLFANLCAGLIYLNRLDHAGAIMSFSAPNEDLVRDLQHRIEISGDHARFYKGLQMSFGPMIKRMAGAVQAAHQDFPAEFKNRLREVALNAVRSTVYQLYDFTSEAADEADKVPTASGFVRIDHNNPAVEEAAEDLEKLADQIKNSNDLLLNDDERRSIIREIITLTQMLQERVVRLSVVATAASSAGVLGYLKGKFPDHLMSALVKKLLDFLYDQFLK